MSDTIIIDTDILVDVARGNEKAASFLDELRRTSGLSPKSPAPSPFI